ncbi:MAG TPA: hypothetical protein VJ650_15990 [Gemmatimonadaceae bacterium]|nr:hypothetical protein [Gemmatimonadaceae bacterium]
MNRARLWSYAGWQARDFVVERGAPLIIVAFLITSPLIVALRRMRETMTPLRAEVTIVELFGQLALIAVLIGINGVVSNDRVRGYYRFLFAKPVSIPRYYAQAYAVNGLGLAAATLGVLGAIYALGYPIFVPRVLLMVGLFYVSLGGVGFLYSTVARFDWILMGATLGLAHVLRDFYPAHASRAGRVIDVILPPYHRLIDVGKELARGGTPESTTVLWLLAWGIGGVVIGLLILRRRPLAA